MNATHIKSSLISETKAGMCEGQRSAFRQSFFDLAKNKNNKKNEQPKTKGKNDTNRPPFLHLADW